MAKVLCLDPQTLEVVYQKPVQKISLTCQHPIQGNQRAVALENHKKMKSL